MVFAVQLLVLIWVGLYFQVHQEKTEEINDAVRNSANLSTAFAEHTLRTMNSADQAVLFLKRQYLLEGKKIDISHYVREGIFSNLPVVLMGVIDEHGDLAASNQAPFVPSNLKDREHFLVHQYLDSGQLFVNVPVVLRAQATTRLELPVLVKGALPPMVPAPEMV